MERTRSRGDDRDERRSRDDDRGGRGREEDRGSRRRESDDDRGSSRGRDREEDRGSSRRRESDDDRGSSRRRESDDDRGSRRGGSGYTYQARSAETTSKRASMGANDFDKLVIDGVKQYKVKDGNNNIRILPPTWKNPEHYGYDLYVHYGVGADRGSYLCLAKMKGEADPIAEERVIAREQGDEEYAKEIDAKRRVGVWLIDRDAEKEGVQFWAMPWTLDRDITKVCQDKATGEVLPIDHPDEGYDVYFERKGAKRNTEYLGVSIARRSSPLGKDAWLEYAVEHPIPEVLQYYSYDEIAKAFGGKGQSRSDRGRDDGDDRGRGRDEDRNSSRSRDREEDRGGRDRSERGGERRREEPEGRSRRSEPDEPTWESVHQMTYSELEDLIEQEKLDIEPKDAKDDEDLADWVCDEMKLKKAETSGRRRERDDEPAADKLRDLRRRRED